MWFLKCLNFYVELQKRYSKCNTKNASHNSGTHFLQSKKDSEFALFNYKLPYNSIRVKSLFTFYYFFSKLLNSNIIICKPNSTICLCCKTPILYVEYQKNLQKNFQIKVDITVIMVYYICNISVINLKFS